MSFRSNNPSRFPIKKSKSHFWTWKLCFKNRKNASNSQTAGGICIKLYKVTQFNVPYNNITVSDLRTARNCSSTREVKWSEMLMKLKLTIENQLIETLTWMRNYCERWRRLTNGDSSVIWRKIQSPTKMKTDPYMHSCMHSYMHSYAYSNMHSYMNSPFIHATFIYSFTRYSFTLLYSLLLQK